MNKSQYLYDKEYYGQLTTIYNFISPKKPETKTVTIKYEIKAAYAQRMETATPILIEKLKKDV